MFCNRMLFKIDIEFIWKHFFHSSTKLFQHIKAILLNWHIKLLILQLEVNNIFFLKYADFAQYNPRPKHYSWLI